MAPGVCIGQGFEGKQKNTGVDRLRGGVRECFRPALAALWPDTAGQLSMLNLHEASHSLRKMKGSQQDDQKHKALQSKVLGSRRM